MFGPMINGYLMNTSDEVLENILTHKVVKGRVPEADPTRAHLELVIKPEKLDRDPSLNHKDIDLDLFYSDLIKNGETKSSVNESEDIDWDLLARYLIKEANKNET